jgi:hypothetical protein
MVAIIYIIFGLKKQHIINFHEQTRKVEDNLHEGGRCMFPTLQTYCIKVYIFDKKIGSS